MRFRSAYSYYGSKSRIIHHYPPPDLQYPLIIEPFAGAGAYCMRWAGLTKHIGMTWPIGQCWLNDLDPKTYAIWKFLTNPHATYCVDGYVPQTIRAGQKVSELLPSSVVEEYPGLLYLLQAEANQGTQGARGVHDQVTKFGEITWPRLKNKLLIWVLPTVKDFKITNLDYRSIPNQPATWFIDPPYNNEAGRRYRTGVGIDYDELAVWCKSRQGQVIVAENAGAKWLPFEELTARAGIKSRYQRSTAHEMLWTND